MKFERKEVKCTSMELIYNLYTDCEITESVQYNINRNVK